MNDKIEESLESIKARLDAVEKQNEELKRQLKQVEANHCNCPEPEPSAWDQFWFGCSDETSYY